jgi:hypothetical protein
MEQEVCMPKVKSIVDIFSEALINKEVKVIESLLSDLGEFEIQSPKLNTLQVNKKRFVSWFTKKILASENLTITFDQCMHCFIGGTVLLINGGQFLRIIKDSSERSKTGLILRIEDNKIVHIKFCYVFVKTTNNYQFEINIAKSNYFKK